MSRICPKVSRIRPNVLWIHPKVLRILPKVLQFRPKVLQFHPKVHKKAPHFGQIRLKHSLLQYMIAGFGFTAPPPQWYGQDSWRRPGRPNLTKITVWAPGGAETLQIQGFGRPEAPKPYKYKGLGAQGRQALAANARTHTHTRTRAHTHTRAHAHTPQAHIPQGGGTIPWGGDRRTRNHIYIYIHLCIYLSFFPKLRL